ICLLDFGERPLPEPERLGMRVVDAENHDPVRGPELDHALELLPQRRPVLGFEVERIDVLVLLWWILRVLDRPIRTVAEPGGMFLDVRMVRRCLERDVQRDLEAVTLGFPDEAVEVLDRPEP